MIVVEVKLVSAISPDRSRPLGRLVLANDGTGSKTKGNYAAQFYGGKGGFGKAATVRDYPREAVAIWNLVRRACEEAGYDK
jgi:hypothetical protein